MGKPFRLASSSSPPPMPAVSPPPGPNHQAVHSAALASGLDVQSYAAAAVRVHDHLPPLPTPPVTPGAPSPMRLR